MTVKVFLKKKPFLGSSERFASVVEQEINAWLEAHPRAKIIEIHQSASGGSFEPSSITVSIWYEEPNQQLQPTGPA